MTMPIVDVPRCSYCFMPKGSRHYERCSRPGLRAEIRLPSANRGGVAEFTGASLASP